MRLGTPELILLLALALLLFGGGKLAGIGGAIGKSIREFKEAVQDDRPKSTESQNT